MTAARGEGGAVLILALVFLIVVGGIVGVLGNSVSSHLEDSVQFKSARTTQYAATSAVDAAIQSTRYAPFLASTLNASPPSQCWNTQQGLFSPSEPASELDGIDVWCSTVWTPTANPTRVVTISACPTTVDASDSLCAIHPLLQAVVDFDDYPGGVSAPNPALCVTYCGSGQSIQSWLWSPDVPVVTQITTGAGNNGPISGATPVTVSGTGFVPFSTSVNFIQETGGVPLTTPAVAPIPGTVNATGTVLTVNSPAVTSGTTYFVTVTTPSGTSPVNPANVFTYLPASTPPLVTGVSVGHTSDPTQGTVNGGDLISITGTGFFAGAQVAFVPVSTGTTESASNVTVTSGTTITALTPSVLAGTNYFVEVTTAGGTTNGVANYTDEFQYVLPVPVVSGIAEAGGTPSAATTGASGSQLTLSGASFASGASVQFYPNDSCGGSNPVAGRNVTVSSPSSISLNAPSLSSSFVKNEEYCVAVTTTAGTSSNTISFTPNS